MERFVAWKFLHQINPFCMFRQKDVWFLILILSAQELSSYCSLNRNFFFLFRMQPRVLLGEEEDLLFWRIAFNQSPTLFLEMTGLKAFFVVAIIGVEMLSDVRILGIAS